MFVVTNSGGVGLGSVVVVVVLAVVLVVLVEVLDVVVPAGRVAKYAAAPPATTMTIIMIAACTFVMAFFENIAPMTVVISYLSLPDTAIIVKFSSKLLLTSYAAFRALPQGEVVRFSAPCLVLG